MSDRLALARDAMRRALQLRQSLSISREDAVNVYDVAAAVGAEVRFVDHPSLEGMFFRAPQPVVVLPCLKHRPRGRVSYTAAHELGHYELGHGTRVDEYIADRGQAEETADEEFAANTFAASLLMTRPAVLRRFHVRGWDPATATSLQLYAVAGELDVGYGTLATHLCYGLHLAGPGWLRARQRTSPKELKEAVVGYPDEACRVLLVDEQWPRVPLELEVGDVVALPAESPVEIPALLSEHRVVGGRRLLVASQPGQARIVISGASHAVRVARSGYCGLLKYRYVEESDED